MGSFDTYETYTEAQSGVSRCDGCRPHLGAKRLEAVTLNNSDHAIQSQEPD